MARLYWRGRKDPILLNNKEAGSLKDKWLKGELPHKVDLGEYVFESKDIRSIDGVMEEDATIYRYDLSISEHKESILLYEKEYKAWKEKDEDKKVDYWWEELGVIRIENKKLGWYTVLDRKSMNEHQAKWSALQGLINSREAADRKSPENLKPLFKKNAV